MLKLKTLPSPSTTSQQPFIGSVEFGVSSETHDRRLWQREAILQAFKHEKSSKKIRIFYNVMYVEICFTWFDNFVFKYKSCYCVKDTKGFTVLSALVNHVQIFSQW